MSRLRWAGRQRSDGHRLSLRKVTLGVAIGALVLGGTSILGSGAAQAASSGAIKGTGSGRCVDVPGQATANLTQVELWDCNGQTNQNWALDSSKQLKVYGSKCLDVNGAATADGTAVQIYDCTGGANQKWTFNGNGTLTDQNSGKCLDATGAGTANGTLLELWSCNGGANQKWSTPGGGSTGGGGTTPTTSSGGGGGSTSGAPYLHVSGNKLLTSTGATYRLLGVNRSGGEFQCIQGNGIWDGPMDQASINTMRTWKIRAVRIPLNEECWVGTNDVNAAYRGSTYQNAVKTYVNLLINSGITPIVEMHWNYGQYTGNSSGCSDVKATCQKPMPDAQYAPSFWSSVASTFKDNRVVFDLFNEPYPDRAGGSTAQTWSCWRDGGTCSGINYKVAGFQTLLNSVRSTGNTNVVMIGGVAYSNDLTQWLNYKPSDSTGNLMAFAHVYNFNGCASTSCYNSQLAPVAAKVPLVISEIGENDCQHSFVDTLMNWADGQGVGYLAWTWNTWDCSTGPALISNYNGTATNFGQGIKNHFASVSN